MKRMKCLNLIFMVLFLSIFGVITPVHASSATVGFNGNSTVAIDNNITIDLYVGNISDTNGGITSISSNLVFDSEYLEYVSGNLLYSGYQGGINPSNNYKISAVGTDGISTKTSVFSFTFKAKKAGTTQVTVANLKVSDNSGKFNATVVPKNITITSATKSNDATLKSLGVTDYTLSPSFSKNVTSYNLTLPEGVTSINITGSPTDTKASVAGIGKVTLSGNTAKVTVTAEDGTTTKDYVINIQRSQPQSQSSDATLKSLGVTNYTLSPSFSKDVTSYNLILPEGVTSINITGSATDTNATVTGLGNVTLTGNTAKVKVTAQDGTTKEYTINIKRSEQTTTDATLKSLGVTGYTLSPSFSGDVTSYIVTVPEGTNSVTLTGSPSDSEATVTGLGNVTLTGDLITTTVKVKTKDGNTKEYIVRITRKSAPVTSKSGDNTLSSLKIYSSHEMYPQFNKDIIAYNVTVPYSVDKLDLSYITNSSAASVTVTGNSNFKVGETNIVKIDVKAEDGSIRSYILNVTRSTYESENDLKDLTVEEGELSPKFNPNSSEYTVKIKDDVDKLNIKATPSNSSSKVEIIGNEDLRDGRNTILIKVTDKNGFIKYYTIDAYKDNKGISIFGLTPLQFCLILLIFLILLLLILLLLKNRKEERSQVPIIEVKPEFNFSSKNTSDDDTVYGNLRQDGIHKSTSVLSLDDKNDSIEAIYDEIEEKIPNDPYDDVVTKREIIDAIEEATRTKDASKLKMLLGQEAINRKKRELKQKEDNKDDDWR